MEMFKIDDSEQGGDRRRPPSSPWYPTLRPSLLTVLAFPFHVISSLFRFLFGVLRIPIPQFRFSNLNFYRPLRPGVSSPRRGPDAWLRELEEETGAVCISRARCAAGSSTATDVAGPSTLTSRAGSGTAKDEAWKVLPDFILSSYEDFVRTCQKEAKIGCVILVSEEHDDVAEFKRSTLSNPDLVNLLYDTGILVWGGDVRDQEAWNAALRLQTTTYPFVAFLALQQRRGPTSTPHPSPSPSLTVLSRHQGPSTPSTAPTSASTLIDHLQRQLLPRVSPFLERVQNSQRDRERDRVLRDEQDRAFQDSARRDREKIEAMIAAESIQAEEKRRKEAEEREEAERIGREADEQERQKFLRMEWRKWARRALQVPDSATGLRMAIRLPGDKRVVHRFSPSSTLTNLFTFVDIHLIPPHIDPSGDPESPPSGSILDETAIEHQISSSEGAADAWWDFKLMHVYPRREIKWKAQCLLSDVESLKGGGQVVVEMIAGSRRSSTDRRRSSETDDSDDGYSTEE